MCDKELDAIRQRKIEKLISSKVLEKKNTNSELNVNEVLNRSFTGRAWEIFHASKSQFPHETMNLKKILLKLILEKKISKINGEQLYIIIKQLGLPIRLTTSIRYLGNGKAKTFSEKFKEAIK